MSHAIEALLITDKGGSPRFYMQLDPKALNMDPVMASSFFAAIDMFSKEVFDEKAPVVQVDYGARLFTLINGVNTNMIAVSVQRLTPESIEVLDSLLAEFELDWLEVVDPFEFSYETSFVDVYLEAFGERVMEKLSLRLLGETWVPYFTTKPDVLESVFSILMEYINGSRNVKEIIEVSGLSQREVVLDLSKLWAHRVIRFRNMFNFNDFMTTGTQFVRYAQATSDETQDLRTLHPDMAGVIPHLAGLIDGRRTVREILAELGTRYDESELLRALDYLIEVGVIEALSPEKRRILLVKEALELAIRVAEGSYNVTEATNGLQFVMRNAKTPEALSQLQLKDGRWMVDFDFKILEGLNQKRLMLLFGEWMKILAQFVNALNPARLTLYIGNLTTVISQRIIRRYSAFDLRGFEEFAYWLEILSTPTKPHVGPIETSHLQIAWSSALEELAYILVTRGHIIYKSESITQIRSATGTPLIDLLPTEWVGRDRIETFERIMVEYSNLGPAAKLTLLVLATQRGVLIPKEVII
ncbi:MAG: hypothetical protein ThorAB25_14360 [Candidatus Thorarchaeota archaeon AB_25]|nr:MAG: hypothetical protein ThorAB25_14360 [Candidatus Thorarchaeota archaeon AB_25]